MAKIKLVTWNINSVRARLPLMEQMLEKYDPDVLCLQETKAEDHQFPSQWFADHGLEHQALAGQKAYHGVATLSKIPFDNKGRRDWCAKGDARHVEVRLPGDVDLHNFYVPAGGHLPDVALSEKFAHKMDFLNEMTDWSADLGSAARAILVGDLNIAPLEHDVWSHKKLITEVSHTPQECEKMLELMAAHDWFDVMRHFIPEPEKIYSWWSYRAKDWRASNKGRRLDHVWTSQTLKDNMKSMEVLLEARGWEKPSDHAPVLVEMDL